MALTPKQNNIALSKFESMLKTNSVYFFDSVEFEEIIHYYLDSGKTNLAKKAIKLGLTQHPNSILLKLLKAELLIFDGEVDKASFLLDELKSIEPTNDEIYVQQASICSKKDEHHKAIDLLKIALEYTDDEVDILSMIGMEFLYLDNFEEAGVSFEKCLQIDFEDYSSLYNVIYCFDMQNKHQEAIDFLNSYINKDPYSEVAWHQLGRQHFILEQYQPALRAFDFAVLIDEFFVGAFLEKAKTLEQLQNYEEAIENYKTALELDDPTAFVYLRIGTCYEKLKKSKLAVKNYLNAVHEDPLLDKGWVAIANVYLKDGNYRKAGYYVNKALEIDEQNATYWRKYSEVNLKLELFEEAAMALKKCLLLNDLDLTIWLGLADVLCYLGDYEDALKYLLKAKVHFPRFSDIEYRLSGLCFKFKNNVKGEKHLCNALNLDFRGQIILKELFPDVFKSEQVQKILKNFKKTS